MRRWTFVSIALSLLVAACGDAGDATTTTPPLAVDTSSTTLTTEPTQTSAPPATTGATDTTTSTSTVTQPAPLTWAEVSAGTGGPAPRRNAVLVVDAASQHAYLHGGRVDGDSVADLWRLDLVSGAWEELPGSNDGPEPRFSHTGVWDEARSRLVLFSGEGERFGDFFSDVWAYDPAGGTWEEIAADGAGPADRYGSCAGYDAAGDRFLISHGFTDTGRFDDTWAFDLATNSWTDVTPDGDVPGARCLHGCGFDAATGSLVMFGGQDDDRAYLDDTWVFDGSSWAEGPAGPSARKFPGLAPGVGGIVVFGGDSADGYLADTWLYAEGGWQELFPAASPSPRESTAAASDSDGSVLIFGGGGPDGDLADFWRLRPGG